jgi:hypothetical protein
MSNRGKPRERGVAMVLAAIWLVAIIAIAAIATEVSRLSDTATEVQVAADAAALAAAQNMAKTNDTTSARTAAQTIAAKNSADGRTPPPGDVFVEFGSYSVAGGYSGSPPVAGTSVLAARATVTMENVRYILASIFGAGTSTSVTKRAVARYACTGTSQPTAPLAICDCALRQYTQDQTCSVQGNNASLTQTPNGSQNSCLLATHSNDGAWFASCPGVGQGNGSPPLISVGDPLPLNNGQIPPVLRDLGSCVDAGVHDYVIPIIHCAAAGCAIGNCNHSGTVVGFATIHINTSHPPDIDTTGGNKSVTFTQICDADAPGTPGPETALCLGQGSAVLVDDRG